MSIAVSISAVQTHTPDVDADEMSNSRHSPSLISVSLGVDYPCCWKPHGSLRSLSLTGTILSIPSHFAPIQLSRSQYFTSSNHLLCGFCLNFLLKACCKSLQAHQTSRWLVPLPWRYTPQLIMMHIVFISLLKMPLSKQASSCSAIRPNYQSQPQLVGFTYIGP